MIIKDKETKKVYYDTGKDEVFLVTSEFWEALKAKRVYYAGGGQSGKKDHIIFYSTRETLNLKDKNFEEIFKRITKNEIAKLVMSGELPVTTKL